MKKFEFDTPEYSRSAPPPAMPKNGADKYITISVAEYHVLTKAAALLEIIMSTDGFARDAVVDAAKKRFPDVPGSIEAGEKE